jgi:hypothetical protein
LISLKKYAAHGLCALVFLLQWKKVQLSGEKCFFRMDRGVSGKFFTQSGCEGAAIDADQAP